MSEPESSETTTGGAVGRLVGKAKAAAGSLLGNSDLEREGRLQQAQADAEARAATANDAARLGREQTTLEEKRLAAADERDRLRGEIEAEDRQEQIEAAEARREEDIE